ncbi:MULTISPECIES: IS110 family transposase [unclassified Sphingobium]|jgi:transposase|uniref:IS110 family transposase n=1 Tax=unclassified Sphingobium TaxID=2611147 RepID=UPI0004467EE8|nr:MULTISPECIES: IS110 family transposase [unclassified Sphingobium]EXS69453.1 transposase [Sphingobium sp. Ant17]KGA95314.1 Transposase [Sphingobium sp. ba1]MDT7531964.1 IS110 family transposase [Sphingobium sp. SA2]PBN41749.1 IS110 family transposase [Sphingobium sp. D43FB]
MSIYAGLDVSDKSTHVCVVDGEGAVLRREVLASDPDVIAKWLGRYCPDLVRVVLETGPLSAFLYHGMVARDVPVECICARHAKGVLSARVNKSDVHDAEGIAQMARTGWFKRIHMKASATHFDRAAIRIRAQLITARTAMINQLRGLLKLFGLRLGSARAPGKRTDRLIVLYAQRPDLEALFAPLMASIEVIEAQLRASNRILEKRAASDPVCARLMTVPGVGPITALTYTMSIEDPRRFARGEDVGAYAGLVPRRSQSGERDTQGHISKAGDPMLRRSLYEAANIILSRVRQPFALQRWGRKLAEVKGPKRARVAVARKLAILLHSLWLNETEFRWV